MSRVIIVSLFLTGLLVSLFSCKKHSFDEPKISDKTYIVISDIHLGDKRSIDGQYGWNLHMKDTLLSFLDYLSINDDWDELIIAGDLIDEWVCPNEYNTFADESGKVISESEFFGNVVACNKDIFDKFAELKNKGHKLVYIPGNHDIQVTEADFDKYLPGLFDQARSYGISGMGEYMPEDELYIEHGHRYDITNAPYIGKVGVDSISDGSILPPGFFVSRLIASSPEKVDSKAGLINGIAEWTDDNIYNIYWDVLGIRYKEDSVATMTDGMTNKYGFNDFAFSESKLFHNIDKYKEPNDGWGIRCMRNKTFFIPSVTESVLSTFFYDFCDKMGMKILENSDVPFHIIVWGHTHEPKFLTSSDSEKGKVIYVNTGCWVDSEIASGVKNTSTYAVIKKYESNKYYVSLRKYSIDGTGQAEVQKLNSDIYSVTNN